MRSDVFSSLETKSRQIYRKSSDHNHNSRVTAWMSVNYPLIRSFSPACTYWQRAFKQRLFKQRFWCNHVIYFSRLLQTCIVIGLLHFYPSLNASCKRSNPNFVYGGLVLFLVWDTAVVSLCYFLEDIVRSRRSFRSFSFFVLLCSFLFNFPLLCFSCGLWLPLCLWGWHQVEILSSFLWFLLWQWISSFDLLKFQIISSVLDKIIRFCLWIFRVILLQMVYDLYSLHLFQYFRLAVYFYNAWHGKILTLVVYCIRRMEFVWSFFYRFILKDCFV